MSRPSQLIRAFFAPAACIAAAVIVVGPPVLVAQSARPQREVPAETAALARGWGLLAQGDAAAAATFSADLLSKHPRSAAVLTLAIDAAIAQRGAMAALDVYEGWLGRRTLEAGYVLRGVAHALLREIARTDRDRGNRLQALEALRADGQNASDLLSADDSATGADPFVSAAAGDEKAAGALIEQLNQPGPGRRVAILALAKSGTPRAIQPITQALSDPDPIVRATAAEALATMQATESVAALQPLLNDPVFSVRFAAANALAALNDASATPWLREMLTSEHAGVRVAAARATSRDSGPEWLSVVRALTKEDDPEIRRQAAELVAPHDPELARAVLEPLLNDPNPAQRQAAADSYIKHATADFAVLRRYLRGHDTGTRIRAADRILELTR